MAQFELVGNYILTHPIVLFYGRGSLTIVFRRLSYVLQSCILVMKDTIEGRI